MVLSNCRNAPAVDGVRSKNRPKPPRSIALPDSFNSTAVPTRGVRFIRSTMPSWSIRPPNSTYHRECGWMRSCANNATSVLVTN